MKHYALAVACALALSIAAPASAVPLPFNATLTLNFGGLGAFTSAGSGTGNFSGAGGPASIPANVIPLQSTAPISPPLLVIDGIAIGGPGVPTGATAPVPAGSNKALSFGGVTGTMGLNASLYLLTSGAQYVAAAIRVGIIGAGGTYQGPPLGMLFMGTIFANPYQLGMVTVMGGLQGVPSTAMGTGFDNRTAGGQGVLQLVTPTLVGLGAIGSLASIGSLTITIVPEPTTALLVGGGLAALGLLRRRYASG